MLVEVRFRANGLRLRTANHEHRHSSLQWMEFVRIHLNICLDKFDHLNSTRARNGSDVLRIYRYGLLLLDDS